MSNTEIEKPFEDFKVPQLITHLESSERSNVDVDSKEISLKDSDEIRAKSESKLTKSKTPKTLIDVPLPYKEPDWSGIPPDQYSLEIIKNGTFLEMFKLQSSLTVFGRLDICDIKFEHPSVSRFHAIIQYCSGDSNHSRGFYLYDLGSTHGTFLNKKKISPKIYYKLKIGYILKFGGSSRLHIFQGPEEEEKVQEEKISPQVEEMCSWGMSDDALEEEDLSENPFALSTPNEELYLDDPKKTLRGWFEREGYELEYDVEEKGFKTFACQIKLPIDTPTGDFMTIEASVSGKKKEAVVACALEACRTLDRLGLLRQSQHESRERKKKNWEENDYYDSDEDTFLDRTGTIEKKREMRKRMVKKPEVETFASIDAKLKAVVTEINEITSKLSAGKNDTQSEINMEDDSLEAYMSTLNDSADKASDKIERRKLKNRLAEAEKEKRHLEKLLEIVRPMKLPPANKYLGMIGKRPKSKLSKVLPKVEEAVSIPKINENEEEVEEDSDTETDNSMKVNEITVLTERKVSANLNKTSPANVPSVKNFIISPPSKSEDAKNEISSKAVVESPISISKEYSVPMEEDNEKPKTYGLILTKAKQSYRSPDTTGSGKSNRSYNMDEVKKSDKESDTKDVKPPAPKKQKNDNEKLVLPNYDTYATESAEYSNWVPPAGQTGDGMTHLNSKYGY